MFLFSKKMSLRIFTVLFLTFSLVSQAEWKKPMDMDEYSFQIETANNLDGTMVVFYLAMDKEIKYIKQKSVNSNEWTKPKALDIYANQIKIGQHADGRLDIFTIGTLGNVLYHVTQKAPNSDEWSKETEIEGAYGSQIEVASNLDGSLALFILQMDKEIATIRETAVNSNKWGKRKDFDTGGNQIAIGKHADGRLEIFNIGTVGNVIYHISQSAPNSDDWAKEKEIKDSYAFQIETANHKDGSLALFFLQMDREIGYIKETAPNSNKWNKKVNMDTGGNQIALGQDADGRLEIFNIGTVGNVLYHISQKAPNSDDWNKEKEMEGYAKQIKVGTNKNGKQTLFVISPALSEIGISAEK